MFELVGDVVEGLVVAAAPVVLVEFGSIFVLGDCLVDVVPLEEVLVLVVGLSV